jgi:hypothetical protein
MMREKVVFKRSIETQNPVTGNLINTVSTYYEPKGASVREITPSVDTIVQKQELGTLIEVVIRYNPSVIIQNGDQIEWRGFYFTSLAPKVDPLRRYVTIKAFSAMETTNRNGSPS